jgi:hypothetical protein
MNLSPLLPLVFSYQQQIFYLIPLVPQMNTIANAVTATLEDLHKSTSKSAVEHRQRTGGWFGKINEWLRWLAVSILKHGKYFWL